MSSGDNCEWFVYIIRASDDSLYTGITTDLERRLKQHQTGKVVPSIFAGAKPVILSTPNLATIEVALQYVRHK